jgi:hypothetical protein
MKVIGWLRKRSDRVISKRKLVLATSETVAEHYPPTLTKRRYCLSIWRCGCSA